MIKGIGASTGIAIGQIQWLKHEKLVITKESVRSVKDEIEWFNTSLENAKKDILDLKAHTLAHVGEKEAAIFDAHAMMLEDPEFIDQILSQVQMGNSCAYATKEVAEGFIAVFSSIDDPYLRERAQDLKDVSDRLIRQILGVKENKISGNQLILVAEDLSPSDTAQLDKNQVIGFLTVIGGITSHSAIMARTIGMPAIVGVGKALETLKDGDFIAMDGDTGICHVNPDEETLGTLRQKALQLEAERVALETLKGSLTYSADGHRVEVACNIGGVKDLDHVLTNDGEGIGLFRSEFLYMDRLDMPSEEEQFEAYSTVLKAMGDKPVVIRTLDIGGDKQLPYLNIPKEENPFLGLRAIRYCLKNEEVFITQIKALLRAGVFGNLRIMMPMISGVSEVRQAKVLIEKAKDCLRKEHQAFSEHYQLGIMIEIPAAAVIADLLAKEVDFFSIGTNDLIQYTVAVDRMNQDISELYDPYNPAVIRLIHHVIESGRRQGIWVGMCGETAGNPDLIGLYLAMGLEEFSMNPSKVLKARKIIKGLDYEKLAPKVDTVLGMSDAAQIKQYVLTHFK